ncbi:MAG: class II aldolase/adducin family protein [Parvibaculaceae bacterium]|nr:class II aldolase/adducin family protein [Parvibaculaceae bacterium]
MSRLVKNIGDEDWARQEVIDTALGMSHSHLSPGKSGNVSRRFGDKILITPSGMAYSDLLPDDIVALSLQGEILSGVRLPSSEWHFHCAIYQARADVRGVVHTHSPYATALACLCRPIPAFHYMVAVAGGDDIPCVPYATFGTDDLAAHVVAGLATRSACLLSHHGQIATGESLAKAYDLAHEVETLAQQYHLACQVGTPALLDGQEMTRVLEKFKTYGKQPED